VIRATRTPTVFVTQEIGLGGVPMNAVARRFADLLGRANQTFAANADEMTVLVSGVPMHWKGRS
jgi:adenosylcobinamide kinase/adenosylcobinamide-phosphate guanylyltransferase